MVNEREQAKEKFIWLARFGYCTRGLVYVLIGVLSVMAATGTGGKTTDTKGALDSILATPYGTVMMAAIALGMFGYALWRLVQAVKDTDKHGTDAKGLATRGGMLISSVTHTLLGIYAVSLIFSLGGGGGDNGSSDLAAKLLQQPWGRWLVLLVALGMLAAAIAHVVKAHKETYKKHLKLDTSKMKKVNWFIKFGLLSRSVIFIIISFFFAYAAWTYDPQQAGGLDAALEFLQGQPYGSILLGIIAFGLIAFGAYSFLEGIYRRIQPE